MAGPMSRLAIAVQSASRRLLDNMRKNSFETKITILEEDAQCQLLMPQSLATKLGLYGNQVHALSIQKIGFIARLNRAVGTFVTGTVMTVAFAESSAKLYRRYRVFSEMGAWEGWVETWRQFKDGDKEQKLEREAWMDDVRDFMAFVRQRLEELAERQAEARKAAEEEAGKTVGRAAEDEAGKHPEVADAGKGEAVEAAKAAEEETGQTAEEVADAGNAVKAAEAEAKDC